MPLSKKSALLGALVSLFCLSACAGVHQVDPASPSAEMTRAAQQIAARGDAAGAMDYYHKALDADPQNGDALTALAVLEEKMGDKAAAEGHVRAALDVDKRNADARRQLARLLLAKGQLAEAKEEYQKVLDRHDDDLKAINGLAVALDRLGEGEKAEKLLRAAVEKNSQDQATVNNLAFFLMRHDRAAEAVTLLDPWLTRKETSVALRQNLSLALAMTGQTHRAESIARLDFQGAALRARLIYLAQAANTGKMPAAASPAPVPLPTLEIGPFSTQAMADAALAAWAPQTDLKTQVVTVLSAEGLPRFVLRVEGKEAAALMGACQRSQGKDRCHMR